MFTITIAGMKGGIGKTATATTLTALLGSYDKKVILVDLNPSQSNASRYFGRQREFETVVDIFIHGNITEDNLRKVIKRTDYPNVDIIPGNETLYRDESEIPINNDVAEIYVLRNALSYIKDEYDFCIIDCGPNINALVKNAFCCSDGLLMPVNDAGTCYDGFMNTYYTVCEVKKTINPGLRILGVFFACTNPHTNTYQYYYDIYKNEVSDLFLDLCVRRDNVFKEADIACLPLPYYVKYSNALLDYERLLQKLDLLTGKSARLLKVKISQGERKEAARKKSSKKQKKKYILEDDN